jgi:hypothetical protein
VRRQVSSRETFRQNSSFCICGRDVHSRVCRLVSAAHDRAGASTGSPAADAHADCDADAQSHAHTKTNGDADARADGNSDAASNTNADSWAHGHADTAADGDADTWTHGHADAAADGDADPASDADADATSDADADTTSDANADTESNTDADSPTRQRRDVSKLHRFHGGRLVQPAHFIGAGRCEFEQLHHFVVGCRHQRLLSEHRRRESESREQRYPHLHGARGRAVSSKRVGRESAMALDARFLHRAAL